MSPAHLLTAALSVSAVRGGTLSLPHIDYLTILPELIFLGGALVMLLHSALIRRTMDAATSTSWALSAATAALVASLVQWYEVSAHGPKVAVAGAVAFDGFSVFVTILVSSATLVAILISHSWLEREGVRGPEMQALMLVSAMGAMLMGAANDLIMVFLGLEILSIALYVLAAFDHRRPASGEAALKYFILGAFSSAVFVYGIALVYGATGTTNLPQIADFLSRNLLLHNGLLLGGLALLLAGFCFKIAAVPFHMWTPDVYQGAPTPVTGFMSAIAKVGGFAALLRVFVSSFGLLRADWQPAIWVIAALTLLLGASVALVQRDVKRMLAYSSINHAGFVLLGLQAATSRGVSDSLYYLFAYAFMALGSFAVVSIVGAKGDGNHRLDAYRSLGRRHPWLAAAFTVFLLGQAGIPFTTGFLAKLAVVEAAVEAHSVWLAGIAMVSAVVAAFFYLGLVRLMWAAPAADAPVAGAPAGAMASVGAATASMQPAERVSAGALASPVGTAAGQVSGSAAGSPAGAGSTSGEEAGSTSEETEEPALSTPLGVGIAIALCAGVTVVFGVIPAPLLDFAHQATLLIR